VPFLSSKKNTSGKQQTRQQGGSRCLFVIGWYGKSPSYRDRRQCLCHFSQKTSMQEKYGRFFLLRWVETYRVFPEFSPSHRGKLGQAKPDRFLLRDKSVSVLKTDTDLS
jgi:hypothetical protein